ncbi:MAG: AGE family epimerase/isomerase [Abditibacteriaceae bacterium]
MNESRRLELLSTYREGLLQDVLPFWLKHGMDREHGGVLTALDRDGALLDSDKSVWFQGRFAWLLATLYADCERNEGWLEAAESCINFLENYCFDEDGQMFFTTTREGAPLRKRRYVFSEAFAVAALATYARATGKQEPATQAQEIFGRMTYLLTTPGLLEPKTSITTRPMKGLATPMILIVTAQELFKATGSPEARQWIDRCIEEIERDFLHREFEAVLETVGPNGEFLDHYDGRTINPGHAIEAAWFILQESRNRGGDEHLKNLGLKILDWSWRWGWDKEHGGILYFRDVKNLPVQEYWHDMKFWWPHNEAIIANLMAYQMTGDEKYFQQHSLVHDWSYAHFPDSEHGEWFGYLHREGSVSSQAKGTLWKGPFHLPRMQWICWQLLEEMKKD